jgi:hypothetical protein
MITLYTVSDWRNAPLSNGKQLSPTVEKKSRLTENEIKAEEKYEQFGKCMTYCSTTK